MYYELGCKIQPLNWPETGHSVKAIRLIDGSIVELPIMPAVNVLVVGTSGYGKTVFTKAYVQGLFDADPNLYGVFFQIKKDDFTAQFLRAQDKVIAYSDTVCPEQNLFRWNLVREVRSYDRSEWDSVLDELTSILFADVLTDSRNRIWAEAARITFGAFVKVILYRYGNNPSNKKLIDAMKTMPRKKFLAFLAEYEPNRSMLADNFEYDPENSEHYTLTKKAGDVFFFLQNVLGKFGGTFMAADGEDTIHNYLRGAYGERLFMLHDHKKKNSSKLFERYFLKYITDEMLSQTSVFSGRLVMVLDEIDKIEGDFGLTQAVTLGRQFGLQVVVSSQSLESLYAVAPELHGEHLTNASLSGFGISAAFHPGDPHTLQTLQALYGQCTSQTITMPLSRYDKPVVSVRQRPIVEDQDFASLDIGEFYLKIRSARPERVKLLI